MESEHLRRTRESRSRGIYKKAQRDYIRRARRHYDDSRGEHLLADGVEARLSRRSRLQLQMEHGLDERLPALFLARRSVQEVQSRLPDLLVLLCFFREFRAAYLARRGGSRQMLADKQDARYIRREVCGSPLVPCVYDGAPGQEAALHGSGVRSVHRVELQAGARLAAARLRYAQKAQGVFAHAQPLL